IPDGQKVAFMQMDGALSQIVNGFIPGDLYYVIYWENARLGGVPAIEVKVGDATVLAAHSRSAVGGANPYVQVYSDSFTADNASIEVSFIKSKPNGGDTTALIDNVNVIRVAPGTAPFISLQPQAQTIEVGTAVTLSAAALGSLPIGYQWLKDGVAISGANGATFSINSVAKTDEANYSIVALNNFGSVT